MASIGSFDGLNQFVWRFSTGYNPGQVVIIASSLENARAQFTERYNITKNLNLGYDGYLRQVEGWTAFEGPYTYLTPQVTESPEYTYPLEFTAWATNWSERQTYRTLLELIQQHEPAQVYPLTNIIISSALDG